MNNIRNRYNTDAILLAMKHNQEMKEAVNREMLKEEITKQVTKEVTEQVRKEVTEKVMEKGMAEGKTEGVYNTQREAMMSVFKVKYPNIDIALISDLTLRQYKDIFNLLLQDATFEEIEAVINK